MEVDTQHYPEQDLEVVGEGLHNHANTEDAAGHLMVQEMVHGFQHMLPAGSNKLKGIMQYCKEIEMLEKLLFYRTSIIRLVLFLKTM